MRVVSPLLKHVAYPFLHHSRWLSRSFPEGGCAVVNYHGVLPDGYAGEDPVLDGNLVSAETLRRQLQFLNRRYRVVAPDDFRRWMEGRAELPPRAVLVTCDDGLLNTLTDMLPILLREGTPCLFFVLGASCGEDPPGLWYEELYRLLARESAGSAGPADFRGRWWNQVREASRLSPEEREEWMNARRTRAGLPAHPRRWRLLDTVGLRKLAAAGMGIGAHTLSHPILSACGDELARREIGESKLRLETALGQAVWAFAYPFGNPETMGEREVRLAREAGFTCAFANTGGGIVDRSRPFLLSRAHVTARMNLGEFEAHLSGTHYRWQYAVRG